MPDNTTGMYKSPRIPAFQFGQERATSNNLYTIIFGVMGKFYSCHPFSPTNGTKTQLPNDRISGPQGAR